MFNLILIQKRKDQKEKKYLQFLNLLIEKK